MSSTSSRIASPKILSRLSPSLDKVKRSAFSKIVGPVTGDSLPPLSPQSTLKKIIDFKNEEQVLDALEFDKLKSSKQHREERENRKEQSSEGMNNRLVLRMPITSSRS